MGGANRSSIHIVVTFKKTTKVSLEVIDLPFGERAGVAVAAEVSE